MISVHIKYFVININIEMFAWLVVSKMNNKKLHLHQNYHHATNEVYNVDLCICFLIFTRHIFQK